MNVYIVVEHDRADSGVLGVFARRQDAVAAVEDAQAEWRKQRNSIDPTPPGWDVSEHEIVVPEPV